MKTQLIKIFIITIFILGMGSMSVYGVENTFQTNVTILDEVGSTPTPTPTPSVSPSTPGSSSGSKPSPTPGTTPYFIPNVMNFKATANRAQKVIHLTWDNPDFDFDNLRIVRSDKFYPRDPSEGEVIYEGKGKNFVDKDVVVGTTYYYAIFVQDHDGEYSSGALAISKIYKSVQGGATSTDPFADIEIISGVHEGIAKLTLADFDFIQDGIKIANIGSTLAIDGTKNLTIILDYNKVPEILKTIALSLSDPEDSESVFPFLLRVNKEKTAYEATIAPLGKSGTYGLNIVVLDYKNQGLKKINGNLRAFVFASIDGVFGTSRNSTNNSYLWWLWLIVIAAIVYAMAYLNRNKKRNEV